MPATIGQPTSHVTRYKPVRLWVGQIYGGREGQVDILCDRQPASLPATIGQPTSHVTRYQPVRLWVGQIFGGRRTGSLTTLGPSPGPSTTTGSLVGVTYLTKGWQVTKMSSAACYIPLALCLLTICSFVSMMPNHIFLHAL